MDTFKKDEDRLLKAFIDEALGTNFLSIPKTTNDWGISKQKIELIVNPRCNQACEYCYIYKYGKELYKNGNVDKEIYLNNLLKLLNTLKSHKTVVLNWDIFGGDLFYNEIIFDILDYLYDYMHFILDTNMVLTKDFQISLPNNLSYILIDEIFEKLLEYQKRFKENHIRIHFSWSTDGKFCTDTREKKTLDDVYWDKMFERVHKLEAGYHPMVSPENIDYWVKNYQWWLDMFQKHNLTFPRWFQPYMLEVRNDGWTDDKIAKYLELLKFMFEKRLEMNNNDISKLAAHLFDGSGIDDSLLMADSGDLLFFKLHDSPPCNNCIGCGIQSTCHIDLSNLQIVPCHRLAYEQLRAGEFITNDEKIIDLKAINPSIYIATHTCAANLLPKCVTCKWNPLCLHGCLGAQFEYSGEVFLPIPSVCNLSKAKYSFMIKLINETGILKCALEKDYIKSDKLKQFLINRSKDMGYTI